ncbi:hypothetical protein BDB01DRAFT_841934 [Pilobolus umbonatus]|nr:hypothetical protein BDB01DRAFT_841934 [Pilobolus umbonatus]
MIIASSLKKEISIPLQPMTTSVSASNFIYEEEERTQEEEEAAVDIVSITGRSQSDVIMQVFGQNSVFSNQVNEILSIKTTHTGLSGKTIRTLCCEGFIHNDTVFISSPFYGNNAGLLSWANGEFQSCMNHLIEIAEEKTGCGALIICIDRRNHKDTINTVLRAFMYIGFEMVDPTIYGQEPGYILVGYEF